MEGNHKGRDRALQRRFECHRLEEHLWSMAYEQIRPVIRRSLKGRSKDRQHHGQYQGQSESRRPNHLARRA
jgi:hypothetical protein